MSKSYINSNACTPVALSQLFSQSFDEVCDRIFEAGGRPYAVTRPVLDRLLAPHGIKQRRMFKRPAVFASWRREKLGAWVLVVTGLGASTGHCVAMRDGLPLDNGWVRFESGRPRYESLRIHAAWQLEKVS
jgi:hypothetical protein